MVRAHSTTEAARFSIGEDDRAAAELEWITARHAELRPKTEAKWDAAMITVGHGRGFVVDGICGRFVITVGACLPEAPPKGEPRYPDLLGSPQGGQRVDARCIFFDSVSDVAVLQYTSLKESDGYRSLMDTTTPLSIASFVGLRLGWLPSDSGIWRPCMLVAVLGCVAVFNGRKRGRLTAPAGAPVLAHDGTAVAIVPASGSEEDDNLDRVATPGIPAREHDPVKLKHSRHWRGSWRIPWG
jgi:hypothetical protein